MSSNSEWVSLRRAAEILGVHPATVRNWADRGDISSRRTPGGHRRFLKAELTQHAQTQQDEILPTEVKIIIQNALGQTRMQVGEGNLADVPWYTAMNEKARVAMRILGRETLEGLRSYLAGGAVDDDLGKAIRLGKEYAEELSDNGLSLPQAMRGFFYFSDFVFNSILTWSEINPPRSATEWATLVRQVNNFTNALLLSIAEYYEEE